ncbi:hypothetical protein NLU13_7047 [Sarocladium strictum]|uniref:ER membrane protein complex subunit 7 beta-sandwich domain-containing protein n=1 Tax=Sarocladium strictum TaxID=5046 RepID=A0AA39GEI6_SARSR|nr:hypothetical protein NLU13_7047 [Sarocladium strictum]
MHLSIPLSLSTLVTLALSTSLTLYLPTKPNPFTLPANTHATLTSLHTRHSAPLSSINTFVFHNVTPGDSYLVDVYSPGHAYQPLRVDVLPDGEIKAWETFRGGDWGNKGEELGVKEGGGGKGVELRALGPKTYFMERPKFSILTILKNPMILMGLVSMVMFIGMPKLMENMDPELKAEFEQHQREGPMNAIFGAATGQAQQQQSPLSNFDMAAYLAGSGKKEGSGSGTAQGVKR